MTKKGPEYLFKVIIKGVTQKNVGYVLSCLDASFCNIDYNPKWGVCLGVKYIEIEDISVTFLLFTLNEESPFEWYTKGSFHDFQYTDRLSLIMELEETAERLLRERKVIN